MPAHRDNPPNVDELYGLDPLIEPGHGESAADDIGGLQPQTVHCPYCGEPFETTLDLSSGSTSYIEDCQICCQPIEFTVEIADDGTLATLRVSRGD